MLKGGVFYKIGTKNPNNGVNILDNNFTNSTSTGNLPYFHFTNLENVFICSNKDPNFTYHSLFISYIDDNINDLEVIKWSINKFLNDLLIKINNENSKINENKIVYKINDLKINDFKFELNIDKKTIILSSNIYITNIKKLNNQIDNKLTNRLNKDTNSYIKGFIN